MTPQTVKTTCPYCGVGCGVLATTEADGSVSIAGDPDHPANFGRLCSKGAALAETLGPEDRLLEPSAYGEQTGWDRALDLVAGKFSEAIQKHGSDSVALYVSGQLLTEDYYVANKLMKGFIGSANIDTNSRLCMASSVVGHIRVFGSDTVPGTYEDLELADLVVLDGSNLAWCHPVLYQRIAEAKRQRPEMRVVLIDPRRTATAEIADLHLSIRPDGDVALFLGLLAHLARCRKLDKAYIERFTSGFDTALEIARSVTQGELEEQTGLPPHQLGQFFDLFTNTPKTVTVYSQGINQSACGTDKVNAILNCHLATGRIGKPGAGPFSVTGQPNAMGGREVGGLATMLAAHMKLDDPHHRHLVQNFWQSPKIASKPGLKAIDLFQAVADGKIKCLWIMATNPADSLPEADAVQEAIRSCPFVVVSDVVAETDTLRHAHVKLPSLAWGEKDGTVTNSERRISRQRRFLPAPGKANADWWQLAEVAKRMGYAEGFNYDNPADIFREHALLSGTDNAGTRDFDISATSGLSNDDYENFKPSLWPLRPGIKEAGERFFSGGRYYTPDRRARFVSVDLPSISTGCEQFPFLLNTGRVRDHWHTMTRTGRSGRLSAHMAEPYVEICSADAAAIGLTEASIALVSSETGSALLRVMISGRVQAGQLFAPMHWNDQFSSSGRVNTLIDRQADPLSGQPASKKTAVNIVPFSAATYGFVISREKPQSIPAKYWAVSRCRNGWRTEFASEHKVVDLHEFTTRILPSADPAATDTLSFADKRGGSQRLALMDGSRLTAAVYSSPNPVAVARAWATEQLNVAEQDPAGRLAIVAGHPGNGEPDRGAIICSCENVGVNEIAAAIQDTGCLSVEGVGIQTRAGTNCGSCRAEIAALIREQLPAAAE